MFFIVFLLYFFFFYLFLLLLFHTVCKFICIHYNCSICILQRRPIVCINDLSERKKSSLSASNIATNETSGISKPSLNRFIPTKTSNSPLIVNLLLFSFFLMLLYLNAYNFTLISNPLNILSNLLPFF